MLEMHIEHCRSRYEDPSQRYMGWVLSHKQNTAKSRRGDQRFQAEVSYWENKALGMCQDYTQFGAHGMLMGGREWRTLELVPKAGTRQRNSRSYLKKSLDCTLLTWLSRVEIWSLWCLSACLLENLPSYFIVFILALRASEEASNFSLTWKPADTWIQISCSPELLYGGVFISHSLQTPRHPGVLWVQHLPSARIQGLVRDIPFRAGERK